MERMDIQEKLDRLEINYDYLKEENEKLEKENKKLKEEIKEIEKNQEYRYNRCMKAENEKLKAMLEE